MTRQPTDLELEQIALGELDGSALGVQADDPRIAALRASNVDLLAAHSPRTVALRVQAQIGGEQRQRWAVRLAVLAPATAVLAFFVLKPTPLLQDEPPDVTVIKGLVPDVQLFGLVNGIAQPITKATAGDRVQLAIVGAGAPHGVLVSIDGRGGVTLHHPADPRDTTALPLGATLQLRDSFVLDDAPAFERFILITSAAPIDVDSVVRAARTLASDAFARAKLPLALARELQQTSRTVTKISSPSREKAP